jgi:hypothetical protein
MMPTNDPIESQHNELYDIPIDVLALSENTTHLLERVGVASVGDCINILQRTGDALIEVPLGFGEAIQTEVKPKLQLLGYWPSDE